MKIQKYFACLTIVLLLTACPGSPAIQETQNTTPEIGAIERTLLSFGDLMDGFSFSGPVEEGALAIPDKASPATHTFEGRLELLGEGENGEWQIHYGGPLKPENKHLPQFDYEFVQHEGNLVPVRRGLIITDHLSWNLHLEPGRTWSEAGDEGYSRASFPFALTWKGSNATLNGTMAFLYNDQYVSKVWYQITQETTISTSLDMWGLLDANYHPAPVLNADDIKSAFSDELAGRFPTQSIETLAEDYPGVDLSSFTHGISPDHLTWYGFVINGVQYLGGCQTRFGIYPYCESMRVPSYSTAKSAFASLALMRLGQKYDPSGPELLIKDYLPETLDSPGNWETVTFDHTLDMATGNFQTSQRMVDEEHWDTDPFWLEDYYPERIQAALNWPSSADPGTVWVYRTFDTFIITSAMDNYLRTLEGGGADIFEFMVDEVYQPLNIGPGFYSTIRTKDNNWSGLPVGGYGLWWIPDDLAKITKFLNVDQGQIDGEQILDPEQLDAALGNNPDDRGVLRDGVGRYNNAFWADEYSSREDPGCRFWVPHMYGYSGIVVALIPNGTAYYYASDNQEFETTNAIQESVKLIPVCTD